MSINNEKSSFKKPNGWNAFYEAVAASIFHNSLKYKFFSYLLLYSLNGQVKKIISKSVNNDQHLSTVMHSPIFLYGLHDGSKRCHVCIILKTTAPYKGNADCANEWVNHGQAKPSCGGRKYILYASSIVIVVT